MQAATTSAAAAAAAADAASRRQKKPAIILSIRQSKAGTRPAVLEGFIAPATTVPYFAESVRRAAAATAATAAVAAAVEELQTPWEMHGSDGLTDHSGGGCGRWTVGVDGGRWVWAVGGQADTEWRSTGGSPGINPGGTPTAAIATSDRCAAQFIEA